MRATMGEIKKLLDQSSVTWKVRQELNGHLCTKLIQPEKVVKFSFTWFGIHKSTN